ncbi:MAG: glycosyltransferase [Candidatus Aminicenantes bacterium]|nr:glycosyltransferase [Candidatus Aminicenantes bacterium]
MNILLVNKYFYPRGGSERSVFDTAGLLQARGHGVSFFSMHHPSNRESPDSRYFVSEVDYERPAPPHLKARAAARLLYSTEARRKLARLLDTARPDLVHLHNIHHQISPSIIPLVKKRGLPVVMTLHDYKMVCPVYTLARNGKPCEECGGGRFSRCVLHRCAKGSWSKSLLAAVEMSLHHKVLGLYRGVDVFLSPSRFLKEKMEEMGFAGRIVHLPHFLPPAGDDPGNPPGEGILYFGRLSSEKGLMTLLEAAGRTSLSWKIAGEGPLRDALEARIRERALTNVSLLGYKTRDGLIPEIRSSMFVVLPSVWYENQPYAILEAFAGERPVVGSRIGGIPELVRDGETGLTFEAGNAADLAEKAMLLVQSPEWVGDMGCKARRLVETEFSPDIHYRRLMDVYEGVLRGKA